MKKYKIIIAGPKYNESYFFETPKEGDIKEEVAEIIKEMEAGNISSITVENIEKENATN